MTQVLRGKVAVITGGTRGFGLAVARAYAAEGAAVVISGRTAQAVESVVAGLTAAGAQASGLRADAAEAAQVQTLAAFALQKHGRFDVWVNNAGTSAPFGPTFAASPDRSTAISSAAQKADADGRFELDGLGAIGYLIDRPLLDLAGLITPEVIPFIADADQLAGWMAAREAGYAVFFPDFSPAYARLAVDPRLRQIYCADHPWTRQVGRRNLCVYRLLESGN